MKKASRTVRVVILASIFGLMLFVGNSKAATVPKFSVATGNSGYMFMNVSGDANSSIKLVYYPFGASTPTTIELGSTDASGNFLSTLSTNVYNIVNGTSAYVTVGGMQSATITWPSFGDATNNNSLSLNKYSASISVGESVIIYSANAALNSAASSNGSASATISNGQATITGVVQGNATINLCSTSGNCNTVTVSVKSHDSPLSLNQSYVTIAAGQGAVVISGNSSITSATSNSSAASAYANNGQVTIIGLSYGTATISVCNSAGTCDSIFVTVQNPSSSSLVISKNLVTVGVGESTVIYALNGTFSNVSGNAPYASVSMNSGAGNNQLSITGVENGTQTVTVCSVSNGCNVVVVTVQGSPSVNNLSLTQRTILLNIGQNTTVTSNSSTIVTVTSDSGVASASVNYGIVTVTAQRAGTAKITACNANNICDNVYVTVQDPYSGVWSINYNSLSLSVGQNAIITASNSTINSASSNSSAVSVQTANGNATITALSSGTAVVSVCNSAGNCKTVNVTVEKNSTSSGTTSSGSNSTGSAGTNPSAFTYTRLLTLNSTGTDVRALQNLLIRLGYMTGKSTGFFGPVTQKALKAFQAKNNIAAVGYTGPSTRAALNAAEKNK